MARIQNVMLAATGFLMLGAGVATAQSPWLKGTTEERLNALAEIQSGLGTVMMEY